MKFKLYETKIFGCYEVLPIKFQDKRGSFTKVFSKKIFIDNGLEHQFEEDYFSISKKGVLRGLHFQNPPFEHAKLVHCLSGEIFDVILDIRKDSNTYGKFDIINLNSEKSNLIYIAPGIAHGFYSLSNNTIVNYKTTSIYSKEHDRGILWNSLNIPWPDDNPIVSIRDSNFKRFNEFSSKF